MLGFVDDIEGNGKTAYPIDHLSKYPAKHCDHTRFFKVGLAGENVRAACSFGTRLSIACDAFGRRKLVDLVKALGDEEA
ncbi:hypothetical protein ABGN05_13095 [Aquibium sp. LZ166]|uniref:Uncharacterized protein n=1 Tax=Aquibium pacificus TaxID=3153579 RepID=A0ABV3SIL4_9HYPH